MSGLHKRQQGAAPAEGIHWLGQGDELDSVPHQDGGQRGRTLARDGGNVRPLVGLLSCLAFAPPLPSVFSWTCGWLALQLLSAHLWEDVHPELRGDVHEAIPLGLPVRLLPLQPVWAPSLSRRGQCLVISWPALNSSKEVKTQYMIFKTPIKK